MAYTGQVALVTGGGSGMGRVAAQNCARTGAAVAFTEVLYHENMNSGVQFACVCPDVVKTPLLQQARDTA